MAASTSSYSISREALLKLVEKARQHKQEDEAKRAEFSILPLADSLANIPSSTVLQGYGKHGELITYNKEQQAFISLATTLESCILIGAAGTGKTTCLMGAITSLIHSGKISPIQDTVGHKFLVHGTPGIIACAYTRRAVANLRKAMPAGMEQNCMTIHKLLEYQPEYFEVVDPDTGETKTQMRFIPTRNAYRPLPDSIKVILIDESSMVSVELFKLLLEALPHGVQFIFIGDIQQLPPVFGSAILGFKMLELKTVELVQVYRQALESPIIAFATDIKDGICKSIKEKQVIETPKGKLTLHPWAKRISADVACATFCKFITLAYDHGKYDPDNDCILIPFNVSFGTFEVNKRIASHLAKVNNREVYEVISGFNKLYFAVGDKVSYDKEDATIVGIKRNPEYLGKMPQPASHTLDYFGFNSGLPTPSDSPASLGEEEIEQLLNQMAAFTGEDEERVKAASHIITVRLTDTEQEFELASASALNALNLAYVQTVHRAQGSEWDKVFFVLHQSHSTMCQRELLYTGVTRAAKDLYILCEPDTFVKGVKSQRIKGDTLEQKAEFFKGKLDSNGGEY